MKTSQSLVRVSAVAAALALGACGGGSGDATVAVPITPVVTTISQAAVVPYMNNSIAGTSDTTAPADINSTALATDETSEPTPI